MVNLKSMCSEETDWLPTHTSTAHGNRLMAAGSGTYQTFLKYMNVQNLSLQEHNVYIFYVENKTVMIKKTVPLR